MELNITIKNTENINNIDDNAKAEIEKIVAALISTGGLTGVKGGQTIIHFDGDAKFAGVQLNYWPFRRRFQ